ncbi:sugar transferase [Amnibacterium kyonggiense]|uniref:Undecaprenyl-phosphate galactose phosphotransferase WbaP/exopolysaccharide biosynthesis polyprenyl glycosylphosphotransferase n=1 Tax=Amnibacterium kyonggiense TaxID=595671 RepID=A0A4V3EBK0_9MICO|nr:sugar transferase [Amnibacterium kyonggiense]TDS80984.1 Undecaprenyl-phosphate galactose phosphotransferase WbaP/exopolysaccharide biosynthesis polyprenyl glycosylphosphotransferase [Amnibacterium kyonggiense]
MTASPVTLQTTAATRTRAAMRWSQRLALQLAVTDTLIVAGTVLTAHLALFGSGQQVSHQEQYAADLPYGVVSLALAVLWIGALAVVDSRDEDEIGTGTTEYRRVIRAGVATLVIMIVVGFFLGVDLSRIWAGAVVPTGTALLLAGRWLWRRRLMARRAAGLDSHRVVLLGSTETVVRTALDLARQPGHGYRVVGVALTDGPTEGTIADLRIVGGVDDVPGSLRALQADTVMATSSDHLSPERIRDLAWHLEPAQHLVVAPSLTDVGGSRIHLRPVAGLPLIHVETPHQAGIGRVMKRLFDVAASALALVLLAPVLAVIAVLVHRDSPGGVIYRQERIGRDGEPFSILKFRSMSADADARRAQLTADQGKGLFKMADDPRITRVGKVLRRYSLDELPQLVNVLRGDMSLVGPRPALPSEVSEYDRRELRRLAVTPGLSGLWQVSGRSDLDWADGIRLDLYYVENWSMTQDLQILWRTAKAVVSSSGAY